MKRVFAFSVVLALIFAVLGAHVSAAQTVPVDIWVDIKNGGTAVIITEVNSPLPDRSSMTLDDGQSEAFHIDFSEEGAFSFFGFLKIVFKPIPAPLFYIKRIICSSSLSRILRIAIFSLKCWVATALKPSA